MAIDPNLMSCDKVLPEFTWEVRYSAESKSSVFIGSSECLTVKVQDRQKRSDCPRWLVKVRFHQSQKEAIVIGQCAGGNLGEAMETAIENGKARLKLASECLGVTL